MRTDPTGTSNEPFDLFRFAGIALTRGVANKRQFSDAFVYHKSYGHLRIVRTIEVGSSSRRLNAQQLALLFMPLPHTNVSRLIPKHLYQWLGYRLTEILDGKPELLPVARDLEKFGIIYLGDLIQLDELEVRSLKCMTDERFMALKRRLTCAGMGFGAATPGWRRVMPRVCAPN